MNFALFFEYNILCNIMSILARIGVTQAKGKGNGPMELDGAMAIFAHHFSNILTLDPLVEFTSRLCIFRTTIIIGKFIWKLYAHRRKRTEVIILCAQKDCLPLRNPGLHGKKFIRLGW